MTDDELLVALIAKAYLEGAELITDFYLRAK